MNVSAAASFAPAIAPPRAVTPQPAPPAPAVAKDADGDGDSDKGGVDIRV